MLIVYRRVNLFSSPLESAFWSTVTPPLGTTERNVGERGFPSHQHSKSAGVIEIGIGVVSNPAFIRSTSSIVLLAVALEHPHGAIVHADR